MRLIEAAAEIARAVRERGVEVESVDYQVPEAGLCDVECRVNFVVGAPLVLRIELSAPVHEETLPREVLSRILRSTVPRPSVH
jgi:hypothetical protein